MLLIKRLCNLCHADIIQILTSNLNSNTGAMISNSETISKPVATMPPQMFLDWECDLYAISFVCFDLECKFYMISVVAG